MNYNRNGMITAVDTTGKRYSGTGVQSRPSSQAHGATRCLWDPLDWRYMGQCTRYHIRDVANTNILYWGGHLLVLLESTNPHSIEPDSLCTIEKTTLKGQLKQNQPFSAHPNVDANMKRV